MSRHSTMLALVLAATLFVLAFGIAASAGWRTAPPAITATVSMDGLAGAGASAAWSGEPQPL
jgi:hypothetical protein